MFSVPYADPRTVIEYWGTPTATIDWCEENYVVLRYVAEFINTTTNLIFMFFAVFAILRLYQNQFEWRFIVGNCGFLLVGVGLWLFHMTLLYEYQLLDELPMLYATCVPFWSILSKGFSKKGEIWAAIGVLSLAATMTIIYIIIRDPTFHQACYAFLNIVIIWKLYMFIGTCVDSSKYQKEVSQMKGLMLKGVSLFLFGWFLWNLDIHLCLQITALKRFVGMPLGFLLEGHGWWHFFTGLGVYYYDIYLEYLRLFELGVQDNYQLTTRFWILPDIETKHTKKVQ